MKLWEINKLMNPDKIFAHVEDKLVDEETGEVFDKEYIDSLPMAQEEKTKNIGLLIKDINGEVGEIEKEIDRLTRMKRTRENRIKSLKSYVLEFGCPVNDVAVTIRFNKGRESLFLEDDVDVKAYGEGYYKETTIVKPDTKAITAAIKGGKEFKGARLIRKPFVVVK